MTTTPFPERMHNQAVETAKRRAERSLDELANEAAIIKRRVGNGTADADDARKSAELVTTIASRLGTLEALRDVQEWDEAERNGEQG
jgi:hypothetical protein